MTSAANTSDDAVDPARRAVRTTRVMFFSVFVFCEAQAGELPARGWIEEITIARTAVTGGSRQRRAAQNKLIDHELAVVFAKRARRGPVSGVRSIRTARPLPDNSV